MCYVVAHKLIGIKSNKHSIKYVNKANIIGGCLTCPIDSRKSESQAEAANREGTVFGVLAAN